MGGIQSLRLQCRYTEATAWWGQDVGALSSRSCWITRVYTCKKPSENHGKTVFLMGKSSISMAIFNSYVKLPEDNKWPSAGDWWNGTGDWSWWSGRGVWLWQKFVAPVASVKLRGFRHSYEQWQLGRTRDAELTWYGFYSASAMLSQYHKNGPRSIR